MNGLLFFCKCMKVSALASQILNTFAKNQRNQTGESRNLDTFAKYQKPSKICAKCWWRKLSAAHLTQIFGIWFFLQMYRGQCRSARYSYSSLPELLKLQTKPRLRSTLKWRKQSPHIKPLYS